MYAALLESTGTSVITHSVSQWLVACNVSAETVAKMSADQGSIQDSGESPAPPFHFHFLHYILLPAVAHTEVVTRLSPLLRLFPSTLSATSLLLHCTWHQANLWSMAVGPQKVCLFSLCCVLKSACAMMYFRVCMCGVVWATQPLYTQVLAFLSRLPEVVLVRGEAIHIVF